IGAVAIQSRAVRLVDPLQKYRFKRCHVREGEGVRIQGSGKTIAFSLVPDPRPLTPYFLINSKTDSSDMFPWHSSFTRMHGACSHAPRHSANSNVALPSDVVAPTFTLSFSHTPASNSSPPRSAQEILRHTHTRFLPKGC